MHSMIGALLVRRRKFSLPTTTPHGGGESSGISKWNTMSGKRGLRIDLKDRGKSGSDKISPRSPRQQAQTAAASTISTTYATSPVKAVSSRFGVGGKSKEGGSTSSGGSSSGKSAGKKPKDKKKGSRSSASSSSPTKPEGVCLDEINVEVLREWEASFNAMLKHPDGIKLFEDFLMSEFSEENIQFWKACESYKTVPDHQVEREAALLYQEYVAPQAPKMVNIDHQTSKEIIENMKSPDHNTFNKAQQSIYLLMARDSFVRFIKSEQFQLALKR